MTSRVVVDASVALKWFPFGDEREVERARGLWEAIRAGKVQAYAPVFMIVEVMNVLFKKKKVKPQILKEVVERLRNSEITFIELEKWEIPGLRELMVEFGVTAYDAHYLLLAKSRKCKVVAVDKPLLEVGEFVIGIKEVI